MPTDSRALIALRNDLLKLLAEAGLESARPAAILFPDPEWEFYVIGPLSIIYKRPETKKAIARFENRVFERRGWRDKWSRDFIRSALSKALVEMDAFDDEHIDAAFMRMTKVLDEEPLLLSVFFAVGGVTLTEDSLEFASVRLFRMNETERARIGGVFNKIIDTIENDDAEKDRYRAQVQEALAIYANLTVAEVTAKGDSRFARLQARHTSKPVWDFLQLITAIEESSERNIRIVAGGDLLARQPPDLIISQDESEAHWDQKFARGNRLDLNSERLERVLNLGFRPIIAAISKSDEDRTEFEKLLINAVHWIADAEKQEDFANRITSYMTALEMFFTSEGGPIVRDIGEGVAYLLTPDLEERIKIRTLVRELYDARSDVSHEGKRAALEGEYRKLKALAINVVAVLSKLSERVKSKAELQRLFSRLRLAAVFDPSDDASPML